MPKWKFKPYAEDDTKENPIHSQFFTTDEVQNVANGIIREGIQNALDERLDPNKPLVIKVALHEGDHSLLPREFSEYVNDLGIHLDAKDSGLRELPDLDKDRMNFLLFEDFNSKGLRGNPNESEDREINDTSKPHNFYYFWRNVGITGKSEGKLGRWGVGKTVFPAASRINTFWGYTIQADTGAELLMGQCVLKKHNVESKNCPWGYKPYGYFGVFNESSFFSQPINDQEYLQKFKKDFKLKRQRESGLSIIVPFYKQEITVNALIASVLEQYFYPIIKGILNVEIESGKKVIEINSFNIDKVLNAFVNEDSDDRLNIHALNRLFNFTKWCQELPDSSYFKLTEPKIQLQPAWSEKLWEGLQIEKLIEAFETQRKIAFKIPVKYHNKERSELAKICWFKLFLEKDDGIDKPEDHFIRENITIIDVKSLDNKGVRGIVVIDDVDLANLLGDSENPAHTQWQKDSQNFINKYEHGDKCIQFITRSLQKVYLKLQRPASGIDRDILSSIFFIENSDFNNYATEPDDDTIKDVDTSPPIIPILSTKIKKIKTQRIDGGLIIKNSNELIDIPIRVNVKVAYMTTRGKPLKKYEIFDFELNKAPIKIKKKGIEIIECRENRLVFEAKKKPFEVTVTGFDVNRDLFIDIQTENYIND